MNKLNEMNNLKKGFCNFKGEEYEFEFLTDIQLESKVKFINTVVQLVVDENSKTYMPILKETMINWMIIKIFTNIDVTEIEENGSQLNEIADFLENTNAVNIVIGNMKEGLYEELISSIDDGIEYKTGIHRNDITTMIASLINELKNKIGDYNPKELIKAMNALNKVKKVKPEDVLNLYLNSEERKTKEFEIIESKNAEIRKLKEELELKK